MSTNYHFITTWQIPARPEEVYRTLEEVNALVRWWPSVYLDVKILEQGDAGGVGKVVALYTKGWLPYTLRWKFTVTEARFPEGFALAAEGDFVGHGRWTFSPSGPDTRVTYDWNIVTRKPLLKYMSWLLKPVFSLNHTWAMQKGQESLLLELRRRAGEHGVPTPPPPTFVNNLAGKFL